MPASCTRCTIPDQVDGTRKMNPTPLSSMYWLRNMYNVTWAVMSFHSTKANQRSTANGIIHEIQLRLHFIFKHIIIISLSLSCCTSQKPGEMWRRPGREKKNNWQWLLKCSLLWNMNKHLNAHKIQMETKVKSKGKAFMEINFLFLSCCSKLRVSQQQVWRFLMKYPPDVSFEKFSTMKVFIKQKSESYKSNLLRTVEYD